MKNRIINTITLILIFTVPTDTQAQQLPLQHGVIAKSNVDVRQYLISEKLDGVRGFWDGKQLWTRQGNKIITPKWFTQYWPNTALDGELWSGRDQFQTIVSCVRKKTVQERCWRNIRLLVFDLPNGKQKFSLRSKNIEKIINKSSSPYLARVKQFSLPSNTALYKKLDEIVAMQGEGLMLHHKDAYYKVGRNKHLMKLKHYQDDEAVVIEHLPGKGKYQHMLGSLLVETKAGLQFKIGTGFSDQQRRTPPAIGAIITYKYVGKTQRGVPRFASFIRIRE
jgi:DNA ligase-1